MRNWGLALIAAVSTVATSAHACVEYSFSPLFAEARIRGADDVWRSAYVEAAGKNIRIEYVHPQTPWGRLVVSGNVTSGRALVFPIKVKRPVRDEARVTWKTSLSEALPEIGLSDKLLEAPFATIFGDRWSERTSAFRGYDCVFDIQEAWKDESTIDKSVCVHESGLPLFMDDAAGRRVFEVTRLVLRQPGDVSPVRFAAPNGYRVTDKKPDYLKSFTC